MSLARAYRDGAPLCVTSPRHGLEPQKGDPVLISSKELSIEKELIVRISTDSPFKGFLLTTQHPGEFIETKGFSRRVPCTGQLGSLSQDFTGLTHDNDDLKAELEIVFVPVDDLKSSDDAVFNLTIVQDYSTYWTGIIV
ncbi:uncharacterized protein LOC111709661 [Eurytemora carolleeae]|uniref:uncharacterized protein LOC111709661 n=1 Tax=Eurytemora carolleeae TaxID=1294199 RepID=UPI000C77B20A|nr:uncharacterized protein LOC111709661 [Eurytemora carolleeae]|eukprot:XP_023339218.1 uncharacterized protein LOC111709661 [Eurytemora affinis]